MDFSSWANQTSMHPVAVIAAFALGTALLFLPRAYAVMPLLVAACFISNDQRVVVITLDFNLVRIMALVGWLRVFLRREYNNLHWATLDTLVLLWVGTRLAVYTAQWAQFSAFVTQLGLVVDTVGIYMLVRCLVSSQADVIRLIRAIALLSLPVAAAFAVEFSTGRNMFSIFGGVDAITAVREGQVRCRGAFSHPIQAGVFWAAALPLIVSCWWTTRSRVLVICGCIASLAIVYMSGSSTPIGALIAGLLFACLFPVRHWLLFVRIAGVASLVFLHFLMNKPIWHLLARITIMRGNTGWHRYNIIDETVNHFGEWWLLGTKSTAHWGWGLVDITNEYVLESVQGGILTLVMFVLVIAEAFRGIGRSMRAHMTSKASNAIAWALGISLSIMCVSFLSIAVFSQMKVIWAVLLGLAGSITPARGVVGRSAGLVVASKDRDLDLKSVTYVTSKSRF